MKKSGSDAGQLICVRRNAGIAKCRLKIKSFAGGIWNLQILEAGSIGDQHCLKAGGIRNPQRLEAGGIRNPQRLEAGGIRNRAGGLNGL